MGSGLSQNTMKIYITTLIFFAGLTISTSTLGDSRNRHISFLPSHVIAPEGIVTLFADYNNQIGSNVPVYLVNRSQKELELSSQDTDIYLKLEFEVAEGTWQRAQPHISSWCGNSYVQVNLNPGYFLKIKGYKPLKGQEARVRYALYGQVFYLNSNVETGIVSEIDISRASSDAMSISEGDFDFVAEVALGRRIVVNRMDHIKDLRRYAIFELGNDRHDKEMALAVLLKISESENRKYADLAKIVMENIGRNYEE